VKLKDQKAYKTGIRWLVGSGTLAILSTGGWFAYHQIFAHSADPVPVRVVRVQRDTVEITINESGTVELRDQQILKSPVEGAVEQVFVKTGNQVENGEQLIVLRNPDSQKNLEQKYSEIRANELNLERNQQKVTEAETKVQAARQALQIIISRREMFEGTRLASQKRTIEKQELALERSRQKVQEAQANLDAEQQELEQLQQLLEKGFIPGNDLQIQEANVRNAEAQLRDAQLQVNQDRLDLENQQLEQQNIAQELRDKFVEDETQERSAKEALQQAQAELKQAQLDVKTLTLEIERQKLDAQDTEEKLQQSILSSPIDGIVLDVAVKAGDGINRSDPLLTLGDPSQELIKLQLSTLNAAKVKPNQEARITVIGPDAKPFQGFVKSLSPLAGAGTTNNNSESSSGQATVAAIVQLNNPTGTLIPGAQVSVEIILDQRQNVLVLNTEAIQRQEKSPFVWIRDPQGNAQKKPVTLGLEGLVTIEVKSGLNKGEQVLLPSPEADLEPGTPVIPQENAGEPESPESSKQ
jgi:HlyD family secretion protein